MIDQLTERYWPAGDKLQVLAGPCAIESREGAMEIAEVLVDICARLDLPLVFKGSYRKANRSRGDSFSGIGDEKALEILAEVRERFGVPVVTDIHAAPEAALAAQYVDVLQIPAFLCRQTDLLYAAAETGKVVNIKKGQFVSPDAMRFAVDKVRERGNERVWLTERGSMFGYQDLVVDMRSFPTMGAFAPTIADITHSLQQPNQASGVTGGRPELIATLGLAAVAAGADGVFIETHPRPEQALSDGANMLHLSRMEGLLRRLQRVHAAVRADQGS
jgi:2-dehydro-3-deoxyphosphooctonate aldolase (KDO 8-P synthase)